MVCLAKSLRSTVFDMNRAEISDENCHVWPSSCHEKKQYCKMLCVKHFLTMTGLQPVKKFSDMNSVLQSALRSELFDSAGWAGISPVKCCSMRCSMND